MPIVDRLRKRFAIGEVYIVADRVLLRITGTTMRLFTALFSKLLFP